MRNSLKALLFGCKPILISFILSNCTYADTTATSTSNNVFVCEGKYAKAYHTDRECYGLGNCKKEITSKRKDDAEMIGRHPCHYCCK